MSREMKDSGVEWIGEIPEDWDIRKIKNCIVNCFGGCWGEDENPQNRHLCIRIADFDFDKQLVKSTASTMRSYTQMQLANGMLKDGDIILEKSGGGEKTPVGRTVLYDEKTHPNAMFANFCNVLRPSVETDNKYFAYILKSLYQTTGMRLFFNQTTGIQNLNMKEYLNAYISFPLLTEQQQIVHFLDRKCSAIDTAIEKTKKSIEKLEEYKKAVITKAVTKGIDPNAKIKDSGVEWIGEIPEGWGVKPLRQFYSRRLNKNKDMLENNLLSLSYGKIVRKNIETNEGLLPESFDGYNIVEPGDIVIRGTDLQNDHRSLRTGLVTERGIITSAYMTLKPNVHVNSEYYHYLLHCYDLAKVFYSMGGGLRQGLDYWEFIRLFVLAPSQKEQYEIVNYIKDKCAAIDTAIAKKKKAIEKLEEYKKSLIYYAVTGKINCRNEVM